MEKEIFATKIQEKSKEPGALFSLTNPVYVSKVTVTSLDQGYQLPEGVYRSILGPILSNPLQNLRSTYGLLKDVQNSLYQTQLFQNVEIKLDTNKVGPKGSSNFTFESKELEGVKLTQPTPVAANIVVKPINPAECPRFTWTQLQNRNILSFSKTFSNLFNRADQQRFFLDTRYDNQAEKWTNTRFSFLSAFPFLPAPALKILFGSTVKRQSCNDTPSVVLETGLKYDLKNKFPDGYISNLYTGLNVKGEPSEILSKQSSNISSIANISSRFTLDTRKYAGEYPTEGSFINLFHEYHLKNNEDDSTLTDIFNRFNKNNKINLNVERYYNFFKERLLFSVIIRTGSSVKPTINPFNWETKPENFKSFPPPTYLVERPPDRKDGIAFYNLFLKAHLPLSFSNPQTPLKLHSSLLFERYSHCCPIKRRTPFISSTTGIMYKTSNAFFQAGYTIPIGDSIGEVCPAGLTLSASISYY